MAKYRVFFDYTEYVEEVTGTDPDTGYDIYEDVCEDYSDTYDIEAASEDEAREEAEDILSQEYNDVYIWKVDERG